MSNSNRSAFKAHHFHLVSPSPWPIFTCISLLSLTTSGVLQLRRMIILAFKPEVISI